MASLDLDALRRALVVVAHPDDESFGLGGVIDALTRRGIRVDVLCFTHGEASTLGEAPDLGPRREAELRSAAALLGVGDVTLGAHADGALAQVAPAALVAEIDAALGDHTAATALLVFDDGGVTGHPDHQAATDAAIACAGARGVAVLSWAVPASVAARLNAELGTSFAGRTDDAIDAWIEVDRAAQRRAIACHASQATDNPVLARRLALSAAHEPLRVLVAPGGIRARGAAAATG